MCDEEIEKFKQRFYAEGKVRRRGKKAGRPRDFEDRNRKKEQGRQRREARDRSREEVPRDSEVVARNAEALRAEQLARDVALAEMKAEIAALGDTQIAVRHKAPSGLASAQVLIDQWRRLDGVGKAASSATDAEIEALRDEIDDFKTWLDRVDDIFSASREAEALYAFAVRDRPIRTWPAVTAAVTDMQDAIAWPVPNKQKFVAAVSAIADAKLILEAAQANLEAMNAGWQAVRTKVLAVKAKVDKPTVRIRAFPAVDATVEALDRSLGEPITADLLTAQAQAALAADIQRVDNWATVVGTKIDGEFFKFLELGISAMQSKKEERRWDFETQRDTLLALLFETPVVTGGQIQAAFKAMLARYGPWTSNQEFAAAKEAAEAEQARLATHFATTWGRPQGEADTLAATYYAVNSRAREAMTRNPLTLADFRTIETQMDGSDAALTYLLRIPAGADTARLALCLRNRHINGANVWARLQAGDVTIAYSDHFLYQSTSIEVELKVEWAVAGMPGISEWCVVHMHYFGTVADAAGFNFAHLKEWSVRKLPESSSGPAGGALTNHSTGMVHPMNLSL